MARFLSIIISAVFIVGSTSVDSRTLSLKEIREDGVIMQQWDASCGAATLATVLTYGMGDSVDERTVAQGMLNLTEPLKVKYRGGFSLLDLKRYSEERGYSAAGYKGLNLGEVLSFYFPIVPILSYGYNHYVVIKGQDKDGKILIADPAFGNTSLRPDEFEQIWMDGMAFVVTKTGQK